MTRMVEIKKGAQVNLKDGDISGGAGGAGVTIGEKATVNIGSGDVTGGDKIVGGAVYVRREGGRGFKGDPRYDEEEQKFKKEVDVCGGVVIKRDGAEVGDGEVDLHQALGGIGGRIVLGPDVIVDMGSAGNITICGVELPQEVLGRISETPFEIARVTDVADTRDKSRTEILAEVTVTQRLSGRSGGERGGRTVKVEVSKLGEGEGAVTGLVKDLPLQSGDKKRQVWKSGVIFNGNPAQMRVLYFEKS